MAGHTAAMGTGRRTPVTVADFEATRARLASLAEDVARTEDKIAATFDELARTGGDPDGHRRRVADEARRSAEAERRRADLAGRQGEGV